MQLTKQLSSVQYSAVKFSGVENSARMDKVHYSSVQCSAVHFLEKVTVQCSYLQQKKVKLSACQCRSAQQTTLH